MSTHITPTPGRIVWYRGDDGEIRPAIVTKGNGPFNADLYVFPREVGDADCGLKLTVTHADPEQEPGCLTSWHWMPYQIGQAKKHDPIAPALTADQAIEQEIQAKGLTAPRVTPAHISATIACEYYFTAEDGACGSNHRGSVSFNGVPHVPALSLLTFCVLVLQNGFTVTGESACASPENFDAEIGRKVARQNAEQKIWALEGYLLKQRLHERAEFDASPKTGGASALPPHPVEQLAADIGGTITSLTVRPDGSGNATMSMPLPADHWLTKPGYDVPPMGFRKGIDDPERDAWAEKICAAGRYAIRGATMNGEDDDFDPDAMLQNLVVGMLGYHTPNGLSKDPGANPDLDSIGVAHHSA